MEESKIPIAIFEYTLAKLIQWKIEVEQKVNNTYTENNFFAKNDFSKIKVIKLHFFVMAYLASSDNSILKDATPFYALPYVPVNSVVYDNLSNLEHFNIDSKCCTLKKQESLDDILNKTGKLTLSTNAKISDFSDKLKDFPNKEIVLNSEFRLVEITHKWFAWKIPFSTALETGKGSRIIPDIIILNSPLIFS